MSRPWPNFYCDRMAVDFPRLSPFPDVHDQGIKIVVLFLFSHGLSGDDHLRDCTEYVPIWDQVR